MDLINTPAFAHRVNELLQESHVPGLAVAVVQNNTLTSNGFGLASIDPPVNITADTLFDIASSSKSLTAASVGLFVVDDDNHPLMQWDTPMSFLLPEDFVMSGDGYTNLVTVEDILSHRSGFPRHDFSYLGIRAEHPDTPQSVTRNLRNLENAALLRKRFMYSNVMYIVASWLVEKMSGLPFVDFLHQRFFEPLGMNSTYLQPDAVIEAGLRDRMAIPHVWDEGNESIRPISWAQAPEAQGCGSIFTSANDYIKWVRAIMNKEAPVSNSLYNGLVKPRIRSDENDEHNPDIPKQWYAAGLIIQDLPSGKATFVGHDGRVSGFTSMFFFLPELKFGAVLLANGDDNSNPINVVANWIVEEVMKSEGFDCHDTRKRKRDLKAPKKKLKYELQQRLCPGRTNGKNEDILLSAYTGRYCNKGYHCLVVEIQENALYINATDRSNPFTATLEYACNERIFLFHMRDDYDGEEGLDAAEFELQDDRAVRLGITFEDELDKHIWFDVVPGETR